MMDPSLLTLIYCISKQATQYFGIPFISTLRTASAPYILFQFRALFAFERFNPPRLLYQSVPIYPPATPSLLIKISRCQNYVGKNEGKIPKWPNMDVGGR